MRRLKRRRARDGRLAALLRRARRHPRALAAAALVAAIAAVAMSGAGERVRASLAESFAVAGVEAGLAVERVLVAGRQRTGSEALIAAVGAGLGTPILAFDLEAARQRVLALPWVREASVSRRLPGTLVVTIEERRPRALWQHEGRIRVVDGRGRPIVEARPQQFAGLLLVVGRGAAAEAGRLTEMLAVAPDLARRVVAAVWVGERRWNLRLDDGIDVQLPEEDAGRAWLALARMDREQGLLARDVLAIDLRLADRLAVRTTPQARARMGGEET